MKDRIIVGLTEEIILKGKKESKKVVARIDTGATNSSIDSSLARDLNLGPIKMTKVIKSAHGNSVRPVREAEVVIEKKKLNVLFTVADRSHMRYKALIGQNVLKQGFLIDPLKGKPGVKR